MIEARCPYFGACGGCTSQNLEYSQQLKDKQAVLAEATGWKDIQVFESAAWNYRNRMDFVFHKDGLGFRRRGSWQEMVDVDHCVISNERLNTLLSEVREFFDDVFYFDVRRRFGTYCYAVIRTPREDSSVSLVLNKKSNKIEDAFKKIESFAGATTAENVLVTLVPYNRNVSVSDEYRVIKGSDFLRERYLEQTFLFPAQGFFQVNHPVAEEVHRYCRGILGGSRTEGSDLLDLYGGVGAFGLLNADLFREVTILENYPPAVKAAFRNIESAGVDNARVIELDARRLREVELERPFSITLDPPRSGMHPKTLKRLNELHPETLIYVSCNPRHLQADLQALDSYQPRSVALFDMFPQTPHMEAVVELVKTGAGS